MISIKEVTKQTGISVRTLRYYDQIDLLIPADRTPGGHRLYSEKELTKLQEIQFLKNLGFSLKEIQHMLSDEQWDWARGLNNQLSYVLKEKEKIVEMEHMLKGLINSLAMDGSVDLGRIQKLIHLYQSNSENKQSYRNTYFQDNEKDLLELLPNMNQSDPDSLEWIALVGQLKQYNDKGVAAPV